MKTCVKYAFTTLLMCSSVSILAENSLDDAIQNGDIGLDLRYRYEFVDQDSFDENAEASTLLARVNYRMQEWHGWQFFLEVDGVAEFLFEDFNSGAGTSGPERSIFPVVADPDGIELNQAWLDYRFNSDTNARFGRQRIVLDNQRFIGGVAWRQNEQTYDAISLNAKPVGEGELFLAYVFNVNRIFGDSVPAGDHDQDTVLAHYQWPLNPQIKLTGYYYDIANNDAPAFSTRTFGIRAGGDHDWGRYQISWGAEAANQADNSNNPVDYTANYLRLDAGFGFEWAKLYGGLEVLEGDDASSGAAFRTPLATLHAFNGWADQFLVTPDDGIEDWFIGISGKLDVYRWNVIWHDFSAESGGRDFGSELDASLSRKFGKHFGLLLKAAFFDADDVAFTDTTRFWLMLTAKF